MLIGMTMLQENQNNLDQQMGNTMLKEATSDHMSDTKWK